MPDFEFKTEATYNPLKVASNSLFAHQFQPLPKSKVIWHARYESIDVVSVLLKFMCWKS